MDTIGWLDGWQQYYPPDVFPSLWAKLDELIAAGEIVSSEEVYVELRVQDAQRFVGGVDSMDEVDGGGA